MKKVLSILGTILSFVFIYIALFERYSITEGIGYFLLALPFLSFFRGFLLKKGMQKKIGL